MLVALTPIPILLIRAVVRKAELIGQEGIIRGPLLLEIWSFLEEIWHAATQ